ncbi:MAG: protein EcsC [Alphaproteobacteria bacterium]|nr:MAG: protein EcsC [Alphaproteobacteria bacterium]
MSDATEPRPGIAAGASRELTRAGREGAPDPALLARIDRLAARERAAGGPILALLAELGSRGESLAARLPPQVRGGLEAATRSALERAYRLALASHGFEDPAWVSHALAVALGAAGGLGGPKTILLELPVTVAVMLRAIQAEARALGFDPSEEGVAFDCIEVFAAAGPEARDDGADLAFLTARMTLEGTSVAALIRKVAPRLAHVLGQKLGAQMVPVLGAASGALINHAYAGYYRELAAVKFGLRRLAVEAGLNERELLALYRERRARLAAPASAPR